MRHGTQARINRQKRALARFSVIGSSVPYQTAEQYDAYLGRKAIEKDSLVKSTSKA